MAEVQTDITPAPMVVPFGGLPDVDRAPTAIPRAEVRFQSLAAAVAAPGAGDNQLVRIICNLPTNYSYVLIECYASIDTVVTGTNNFDNRADLFIVDDASGVNRQYRIRIPFTADGAVIFSSGVQTKNYAAHHFDLPRVTILPQPPGTAPQLFATLNNQTDNDIAYQVNFFARFLQYSVRQATLSGVNAPQPVR